MNWNEHRLKEGYYEYEQILCDGCNSAVDLSDADSFRGAVTIWNVHVQEKHPDALG